MRHLSWAELGVLGVAGVTLPSACLFAAAEGVRRMLETAKGDGSLANTGDHVMGLDAYYRTVGLAGQNEREQRYDAEAARLVRRAE